ncbi:LuxR family transcriptional regulator [Kutzneria sp. CA-103260]|uniref:LuxR family transcriptional regulator n=1 Tax=Kutzneria sp. CA-103260 TaxID=2802641 RepID=UPI001BA622DF|nr:LuxR C-terminal-related transcriptional regulator [Kutzneria sp. CA-103260]QUQ71198.1 two-component system response regulator [Kutzneria sp. CA-103260]
MRPPVLVIDDHAIVATSLVLALRAQGIPAKRCPVTSEAAIIAEAQAGEERGIVLLDMDLGLDVDGADLVLPLKAMGWQVLVVTGSSSRNRIAAAVVAGAIGWVSKAAPFEELLQAAVAAAAGRSTLSERERRELVELNRGDRDRTRLLDRLTAREREVLDRLAAGQRAAKVAEEFVVSVATVRSQIRSILAKLEVGSQLEAVALARSGGSSGR